jgi:excisionase family DNA binding protein
MRLIDDGRDDRPSTDPSSPARPAEDQRFLLTPAEAASRLGIGRTTLYGLLASGELPSVTIGRCRRVAADALVNHVERLGTAGQNGRCTRPLPSCRRCTARGVPPESLVPGELADR